MVDNGEIKSRMNFVPKFGNIKIKHKDTTVEQLRLIELNLRKKICGNKIKLLMKKLRPLILN